MVLACAVFTASIVQSNIARSNDPAVGPFFESDVRAILKLHCFHCHGEDGVRESKLDVRLVRYLQAGGESGPAIKPGSASDSLLVQRIESGEMPPKGKGLSEQELKTLRRWIDEGARTKREEPESLDQGNYWTDEERNYWAFQVPTRHELPRVEHGELVETPIDNFLLSELEKVGRSYNPVASRAALIRRLSFTLLGLPPDPQSIESFMQDTAPDAYARLVDRYLASPAYGERWARHWLDAAGYADSDGYTENDAVRPWAFRYRDYVIRSFNDSKPLNQWIVEQLAGDELVSPDYENLDDQAIECLSATGFLRTAPDGTGDRGVDMDVAKNDVIAETIKIVSTSLMGMTVGCAQCHDHRYDPISQVDYYRFRAIFEPAIDPKNWRNKSARQASILSREERELVKRVDEDLKAIDARQTAELDCIVDAIFERELFKLPEDMQKLAIDARTTPGDKRTPEQKQLMKDHPSLNVDRGSAYLYEPGRLNDFNKRWDALKSSVRAERPADQAVAFLNEVPGKVPVTHVFYRGDFNQPREAVEPGVMSVLPDSPKIATDDDYLPTTGRRLAFARYLTSDRHPLTTRSLVNRIWMHHFGRGLVNSPGDFGALGERPTHPELLDWLAVELVDSGWDMKHIHRCILLSRAWQQSSHRDTNANDDPENRLLGRMPLRRLEAEAIRDAMIDVAGMRVSSMYGPPATVSPDDVGQVIVGSATRDGNGIMVAQLQDDPEQYRRSIYVQVRRTLPLGMLEPFDLAGLAPNCDKRSASTVTPQALLMMNNQVCVRISERFASRLLREVGDDVRLQARRAVELALGVQPNESQLESAVAFLHSQREWFEQRKQTEDAKAAAEADAKKNEKEKEAKSKTGKKKDAGPPPVELTPSEQALALYCQALLSSNQFLYLD